MQGISVDHEGRKGGSTHIVQFHEGEELQQAIDILFALENFLFQFHNG